MENIFKQLRKHKGLNQEQVAEQLCVNQASVSKWEIEKTIPDIIMLGKIADFYNVSMGFLAVNMKNENGNKQTFIRDERGNPYASLSEYLSSSSISYRPSKNVSQNINCIRIPVLGTIPAGIPLEMIEDILDYQELNPRQFNPNKEWFGLRIKGDSMLPKYTEGDNIIVEKKEDCESGNDCVVMVNGQDATLKRVFKNESGITLQPLNPVYQAMHYSNKQIKELPITILGIAREIRRQA